LPLNAYPAFDTNCDGEVGIDQLIRCRERRVEFVNASWHCIRGRAAATAPLGSSEIIRDRAPRPARLAAGALTRER